MDRKISIGEFSRLTGVPIKTLRDWDARGRIKAERYKTGKYSKRYYKLEQIDKIIGDQRDKEVKIGFKNGHLAEAELDSLSELELYELLLEVSRVRNSRVGG